MVRSIVSHQHYYLLLQPLGPQVAITLHLAGSSY